QQQRSGRTIEGGEVWQPAGSEGGSERRAAQIQPRPSSQRVGVSDSSGVRGDVSSARPRCITPGRGNICNDWSDSHSAWYIKWGQATWFVTSTQPRRHGRLSGHRAAQTCNLSGTRSRVEGDSRSRANEVP